MNGCLNRKCRYELLLAVRQFSVSFRVMDVITPVYAAIIGLIYVLLSVRALRLRHRFKVGIGDGGQPLLARAIRAHANFAEYIPISLLLIYFVEISVTAVIWTHALSGTLLLGRLVHAYGISQVDEDYRFRVTGMALTLTTIVVASLTVLSAAVFRL